MTDDEVLFHLTEGTGTMSPEMLHVFSDMKVNIAVSAAMAVCWWYWWAVNFSRMATEYEADLKKAARYLAIVRTVGVLVFGGFLSFHVWLFWLSVIDVYAHPAEWAVVGHTVKIWWNKDARHIFELFVDLFVKMAFD